MKKFLFFTAIFTFVIAIGINGMTNKTNNTEYKPVTHGKIDFAAKNLDDLIANSDAIVEAVATSDNSSLQYLKANFVQTKLDVKKVFKGIEIIDGKQVTLLQTQMVEDPIVNPGERVLLFLKRYEGPITSEKAFISQGLYQGHYKIKGEDIEPSFNLLEPAINSSKSAINSSESLSSDIVKFKKYEKMVEKLSKGK